jgi:hypothetical protein
VRKVGGKDCHEPCEKLNKLTTITNDWVFLSRLLLLLLLLDLQLILGLASWHRWSVTNEGRLLLWLPTTTARGFTQEAGALKRVSIEFAV